MVQSSTFFTCPQDVCKSFMWCIKPIGPNVVPCGTPALIVVTSDLYSLFALAQERCQPFDDEVREAK